MQEQSRQKRILVAVAPDSVQRMTDLLGDEYALFWANSVAHAQTLLGQHRFDLILCGARFDDSRLLDLLQYCKANEQLASIPFLSMRVKRGRLPVDTFRDLVLASSALGAAGFVDLEQWSRQLGDDQAAHEFQLLVERYLAS